MESPKDRLKIIYSSILIRNNNQIKAIQMLQSLKNLRFHPSIIRIFIELIHFTSLKTKHIVFFQESILYWLKKNDLQDFIEVILRNCFFLFENCKYKEFLKMYNKLVKSSKTNNKLKMKLLCCLESSNFSKIKGTFNISQVNNLLKINLFNLLEEGCLKSRKAKKRI